MTQPAARGYLMGSLLVVGLVAVLTFKCYREVTVADRKLDDANALFAAGRYAEARAAYEAAGKAGADALLCAGAVAECDFFLGDDARLMADCDALNAMPGGEGKAWFFKGQAARRRRNWPVARHSLEMAVRCRCPYPPANGALLAMAGEAR